MFVDANEDGVDDSDVDPDSFAINAFGDSAETVVVTSEGDDVFTVTLDTDSTALTMVDASAVAGDLTYVADGAVAGTTVKGGSGDDTLTADGEQDVLMGNAGDDTFNAGDLTQIYGGAGADIFNFAVATNLTKVSTVHDAGSGDVFQLGAGQLFYGEGAQFNPNTTTDVLGKVNAALEQTGGGEASWFQHGSNTYIVIDGSGDLPGAVDQFDAGVDNVIEIVGLIDLGAEATYNQTNGTLEIA